MSQRRCQTVLTIATAIIHQRWRDRGYTCNSRLVILKLSVRSSPDHQASPCVYVMRVFRIQHTCPVVECALKLVMHAQAQLHFCRWSGEQAVGESTGQSSSQQRTLQSPSAHVPVDELHLTKGLSPSVHLGRWVSAVCLEEVFTCSNGSSVEQIMPNPVLSLSLWWVRRPACG